MNKMQSLALRATLLAVALGSAGPALAGPYCTDNRSGVSIQFGFGNRLFPGGTSAEERQNEEDLRRLRRAGVDATRVEKLSGCLRAFVRSQGGGEHMEFYDPNTLERVY